MEKSIKNPLVSIVIPTYNSWWILENTLNSIKNQSYENIEIIVVDNNSTDDTKEIALEFTNNIFNKWPERTAQKNYWINKARWEYVFFVDSDMLLTNDVVENCVNLYKNNENIWGICSPEKSVWKWFFVKVRDYERSFYQNTNIESARFFKLVDVKEVWWFEEDVIFFEESLLPQKIESKLQKSCKFRQGSYIHHDEWNVNIIKWLKKKFYYGKSLDIYKRKVKDIWVEETWNSQMWIIHRYMIFLRNTRFYKRPLLAFWVLFLKTLEFGAGWLGLFFSKLIK